MKIGIDTSITRINQAGSGIYATNLVEALQRIDSADTFCLFSGARHRSMWQHKTLRSRLDTIYRDMAWTHAVLPWRAHQADVDVLHVPISVMPVIAPCPTVITILDTTVLQTPQNFTTWHRHYSRVFIPLSARHASVILTISEQSKHDIVEHLHVPADNIVVTYLAASPRFQPVPAQTISAVKQRYSLSSYILTVGTLEPRKNIGRLVQAYASLLQEPGLTACQLVHAGPQGWLYDDILAEVRRLGLQESVRFLGHVPPDDLIGLYNGASVFVYPSLYEGFGIPILEAMACRCPVITSNVSAMPEVAGDAAILIDPTSVEQIADAIQRVLDDPVLAGDLREKGWRRAATFSWERCAQETLTAYGRAALRSRRT